MPQYSYRTDDGELVLVQMSVHEEQPEYITTYDGRVAKRDVASDFKGQTAKATPGNWPMLSDSMAVLPEQREEAMAAAAAAGVPTFFHEDGRPEFTSPKHKRRYLRSKGFHEKNSFN